MTILYTTMSNSILLKHDKFTIKLINFNLYKLYLLSTLLIIILLIKQSQANKEEINNSRDTFHEDLFIRPLVDGRLFAQFQFKTRYRKDIKSLKWENKFDIFPLSLADLVAITDINRLHYSLTKGNWNYRFWGYSTRPSPPGAQIRVQFSKHNEDAEKSWKRLVNSLAGLFCSSLISATNKKNVVASKLTFGHHYPTSLPNSTDNDVLYVNLPEETFCTENLTPWKKLLPCYSNSGLASLLNAVNLLKSSYSSLAIDLEPVACDKQQQTDDLSKQAEGLCEQVQLTQTISVIFNPLHLFENKQTWSLAKIFGNSITKACPSASHSRVYVDISELDDKNKLYPQTYREHVININSNDNHVDIEKLEKRTYAEFDINSMLTNSSSSKVAINIGIKQNQLFKRPSINSRPRIPVYFETNVAGIGASDGTIVAKITNEYDKPIRVAYMDVVPHFLRVYLHTLTIKTKTGQELKPDKINFVLSKETSSTLIEFSIILPPNSNTQISYDFERAFLRWTDFNPDANKGVLVGSAIIDISLCSALNHLVFPINTISSNSTVLDCNTSDEGDVLKIYARPLLFILPTPDFSMPYNVICLVCTILMLAFGPLHTLTTRKPVIKVNKKSSDGTSNGEHNELPEAEESRKNE